MIKNFEFDFSLDIYRVTNQHISLKWYHRDSKRISQKKSWNSKKYYFKDKVEAFIIEDKKKNSFAWLVKHELNKNTGEERITPIRQAKIVEYYNNCSQVRIRRKTKRK
jgi:hypothetical protein